MGFRLAILRDLKTSAGLSIAVEYDKAQFSHKLQARVRDYLKLKKEANKEDQESFTEDEITEVVKFAFAAICSELKDETLTIP